MRTHTTDHVKSHSQTPCQGGKKKNWRQGPDKSRNGSTAVLENNHVSAHSVQIPEPSTSTICFQMTNAQPRVLTFNCSINSCKGLVPLSNKLFQDWRLRTIITCHCSHPTEELEDVWQDAVVVTVMSSTGLWAWQCDPSKGFTSSSSGLDQPQLSKPRRNI